MKKSIYIFVFALFASLYSYSQGVDFGLKGGLNYASFDIENASTQGRGGAMVGAFIKLKTSDHFAIQPEVLLMQRSGNLTYNNETVQGTGSFTFNYIDVPVMFVYNPVSVFNIHFGPYASYLSSVSVNSKGVSNYDFDAVKKSEFNDWDFGVAAGVGVDVLFLTGGIRYNMGLTQVGNGSRGYILANGRTSVVTVYAGISF